MLVGGGVMKQKESTTKRVSFKTDEQPDFENEQDEFIEQQEQQQPARKESAHEDPDVSHCHILDTFSRLIK